MCGSSLRGVPSGSHAPIHNLPPLEHLDSRAPCGAHGAEVSLHTHLCGTLVVTSLLMCIPEGELHKECSTRFT